MHRKWRKPIDGYSGFLFYDDNGRPLVAMHWQHRFNHMVGRYNDIYRVQMPNITPHVCRHTYCSNMAKSGMNPKTLQYLMGHSDIGVTLNTYTHLGLEDIVFAPSEVEKDKLVCVTGISPSNRLYPADDLFLYRAKELYADLDLVDELDVFGMSPFGDESIIEKINEKNLIRIFVYNKNENDETKVWESKLKCKYELLESDDMK